MSKQVYKAKRGELSSFELYGHRLQDGSITLGEERTPMKDFPKEVKILGRIYQLKETKDTGDAGTLEWGYYEVR